MMRQDQAVILLAKRLRIETSPQNIVENMDVAQLQPSGFGVFNVVSVEALVQDDILYIMPV